MVKTYLPEGVALAAAAEPLAAAELTDAEAPLALALPLPLADALAPPVVLMISPAHPPALTYCLKSIQKAKHPKWQSQQQLGKRQILYHWFHRR